MRSLAAVIALLLVGAAPPASPGKITSIEVRFFDAEKGAFGSNVLKDGAFFGWNDFMWEGNGGYGRGDALILVGLALPDRDGRNFVIDGPLTITARTREKTFVQRSFAKIVVPPNGEVFRAAYVKDIGCAGQIDVLAELGAQTESASLDMSCGE